METKWAVEAFSSLAQETRLAVFCLLVCKGPDGMAAGDIAEALGVPGPTMSFHLAHLSRAGLVQSRRTGRSLVYAVDLDGIRALLLFLTQDCCGGRPELCGDLAREATRTAGRAAKPRKLTKLG